MMTIESDFKKTCIEIKKSHALKDCFSSHYFNVCPLDSLHDNEKYKNKETLKYAHCMHFNRFTDEQIDDLKKLVVEAIENEQPEPPRPWYMFWGSEKDKGDL